MSALRIAVRQFAKAAKSPHAPPRIAVCPLCAMNLTSQVVLSGCGVFDGSEVHEAAYCLLHLSREGANVAIYAPNISQRKVVNHLTGKDEHGEKRNVLVESARIARGH